MHENIKLYSAIKVADLLCDFLRISGLAISSVM